MSGIRAMQSFLLHIAFKGATPNERLARAGKILDRELTKLGSFRVLYMLPERGTIGFILDSTRSHERMVSWLYAMTFEGRPGPDTSPVIRDHDEWFLTEVGAMRASGNHKLEEWCRAHQSNSGGHEDSPSQ